MTVTPTTLKMLHEPFQEFNISWRAGAISGGKAQALPYIDNRVIMNYLDETVGPENWYNEYFEVVADGRLLAVRCTLFLHLESGWVGKSDAAPAVQSREGGPVDLAIKGAYSDSMKRAAVHWGLGRYLYAYRAPWVPVNERGHLLEIPCLPAQMLPAGATVAGAEVPADAIAQSPAIAPDAKVAPAVEPKPEAPAISAPEPVAEPVAPVAAKPVARSVSVPKEVPVVVAQATVDTVPEGSSDEPVLPPEQQKLVSELLARLGKLPAQMLRQYVEGPKGHEKLTADSRTHLLKAITEFETANA